MLQKEFKQITKDCFENYGFQTVDKKFYLELPNIIIRALFLPYPFAKGLFLDWEMRVKALSNLGDGITEQTIEAFDDVSVIPVQMPMLNHLVVRNKKSVKNVFVAEEWEAEAWREGLNQALVKTFDAFKQNDLKELKKRIRSKDDNRRIVVNQKVKSFLGIR